MSTRVKFLLLIFLSFGATALSLTLFLSTDYAQNERAYFKTYPYHEMAARKSPPAPVVKEITTAEIITPKKPFILVQVAPPQRAVTIPKKKPPEPRKKTPPEEFIPKPVKIEELHPVQKKQPAKKRRHDAELGYAAYAQRDYKSAIQHFEQALKTSPGKRDIRLQLAYAYKITGQNDLAVQNFKTAIDSGGQNFALRREVEQLENRFEVSSYAIYRDESSSTRQLGADLTRSQTGLEVSYQPENIGFRNGRKFQIYGRLLSAMKQDSLAIDPDSHQGGIGLRLKPLANQNLVLSAERLVKVGEFARNDWMIRAGYSYDHGTDYQPDKAGWWSYSLYLDAALIDPSSPDIFLTSQVTGGYSMTLAEGLVLQPRLTALGSWQKDSFRTASLFEAGPGVNIRYYFNETKYEAYRGYLDLTVEYRLKLSGNSVGGSGPIVGLTFHF